MPAHTAQRPWVPDAWRVLAASLVFASHYNQQHPWLREGHIGVNIFFILSGYLLMGQGLATPTLGLPYWRRWAVKRLAKLFTLHTLFYGAWLAFYGLPIWGEAVANLLLLKAFWPSLLFTGLPQSWSLTVELCFYLSFPAWAWLARRHKNWFWAIGILLVILVVCLYGLQAYYLLLYALPGRCLDFWLGMAVAVGVARRPTPVHASGTLASPALTDTLPGTLTLLFGISPALAALFTWSLRFKGNSPVCLAGASGATYAFYLLHLGPWANALAITVNHNTALTFVLLWFAAFAIHSFVEKPILDVFTSKATNH